jgi:hypothetical protein
VTATGLLTLAAQRGLKVTVDPDGQHIDVEGPSAAIDELAPTLSHNKAAILAHLHGQVTGKVLPFVLPRPDARALLGHCIRVRPDTSTTTADIEALAAHFAAMGREGAIASERRLWAWWKGTANPTVAAA